MKKTSLTMVLLASLGVAACTQPNTDSRIYSSSAAMQAQHVQMGTVTAVRSVEMRTMDGNSDRVVGAIAGGVVGALAGDQFGKGNGNTIMTGLGAVAGAAAGDSIARNANRVQAQEWTVRLDNGGMIAVIQNDTNLFIGQYVRVINDGTRTRLVY